MLPYQFRKDLGQNWARMKYFKLGKLMETIIKI